MDDTAQNSQQLPTQQPVPPVVVQPISITSGKEHAPVVVESSVAPVESLPEIPQEVKEAGVEAVADKETRELKLEDQRAGFSAQNEATPVVTAPTNTVQFPISEDEAKTITSKKDTAKSLTWLAALIIRQAKILHGKFFSKKS